MSQALIYGKSDLQGVVSVEDTGNGIMKIYTQDADGKIDVQDQLTDYWILTNEPQDKMSIELKGNGFFKYKNIFSTRRDYEHAKKYCYRRWDLKDKFFIVHDPKETFMVQSGVTHYKGLKHDQVSVLSFDIETTGIDHNADAKVLLISNTYRDVKGNVQRRMFCYDEYEDDKTFIDAWCNWVREVDPSIIVGHNLYNFDILYLDFVADRAGTDLNLGRENVSCRFNSYTSKFRKDGSQFYEYRKFFIPGREIVDTFFLSIKYDIGRKYESYGLKSIIKQEGLEIKDRQFYDAAQIRHNYKDPVEWEKIKQYALHDADDALALWDLMGPSYFYMTQNVPKSLQEMICSASGSQLNSMMVRAYLQEDYSIPKASDAVKYVGAISAAKPGIYSNILKLDVASLYPSIMIQYEVYDKEKDSKGYFKELVKTFTELRLQYKKLAKQDKYYDDLQMAYKLFINSAYGFLGASGLCFNSPSNAAFITAKGREILIKSIEWATGNTFEKWIKATDKEKIEEVIDEPT